MNLSRDKSGQALLEFAFVLPMLCIFLLGAVDYGRAVYQAEVITNLAGEGSSVASRSNLGSLQANLQAAGNTVMADSDLRMTANGCAILTAVTSPSSGQYAITGQSQPNDPACTISVTSRIGCYPPSGTCNVNIVHIPTGVQNALTNEPSGSTVYVTEVFYKYFYVTPVGSLLHGTGALPSQLYAVAFY
jgi:Flp pilus assembly protein TadG